LLPPGELFNALQKSSHNGAFLVTEMRWRLF
jgi:hypothetical protein